TGRALDLGADVRRVIEAHVRLRRVTVDALPRQIEALGLQVGEGFDQRAVRRDLRVADHAGRDAGDAGDRSLLNASLAVGTEQLLGQVQLMRGITQLTPP